MLQQRIEAKWIDCFAEAFALCGVKSGDSAVVLSETQSRPVNVQLAELALNRLGARVFHVVLTTPRLNAPVPVRSTGASDAIQGLAPVVHALAATEFIADLTVEGLLHAAELPQILAGGARVLMVSNEHPEVLERCMPDTALEPRVKAGMKLLKNARQMHVTSAAGTDLRISLEGARVGGGWGYTARPGTISHWPGGLCLAFPASGSVNGRLVLDEGDVNLTFKRYLEKPVALTIENDFVTDIAGKHLDAELMRGYFAAWGDREAYAVSHVGWGMNPKARWDAMAFYDKNDFNGTELRAFAGNFLYSTGANEVAGRHTLGHFDLPLKGCTVRLDDHVVVDAGQLSAGLA
ncbi:MAG TPA: peptidase M29 [Burkholderiaceae bacterium]|nr:peptidase M29 [Burkholderiaceae bacterium]